MLEISVIIAAYNAEKFIRKAVESAVGFSEVKEIIVVEDCSTDNTLHECKKLEQDYYKVKLYQHPGKINKGAGASWNLGIKNSTCDLIAILGADDYYLPNRFDAEREVFNINNGVDGVYGAIGTYYYSPNVKKLFEKAAIKEITTISEFVPPENLPYVLLSMSNTIKGYFSLDALTIKKELLIKINCFNENLRLHQDTDLIIKTSIMGNLVPGIIHSPVSMRGAHEDNRIINIANKYKSRFMLYSELNKWIILQEQVDSKIINFIETKKCIYEILFLEKRTFNKVIKFFILIKEKPYLFYIQREFNFIVKSVLGDNIVIKVLLRIKEYFFKILLPHKISYLTNYYYSK